MSGIEFKPEDMSSDRGHELAIAQFMKKAADSGNASGLSDVEFKDILHLISDFKRRGQDEDHEGVAVVESFLSKHGVTVFMAVLSATISALLSAGGVWLGIRDELTLQRNDIANLQRDFKSFADDRDKYRSRYLPMVEDNKEVNQRQDQNMNTMRESINRLAALVDTQAKSISETHEDVAVLKNAIAGRLFPQHN